MSVPHFSFARLIDRGAARPWLLDQLLEQIYHMPPRGQHSQILVGPERLFSTLSKLNVMFGNSPPAQPRYFSLVQMEGHTLLFARCGRYAHEYRTIAVSITQRNHSSGSTSSDEYEIGAGPRQHLPGRVNGVIRSAHVSHNAAFVTRSLSLSRGKTFTMRQLWAVGGQHIAKQPPLPADLANKSWWWHPSHRQGIFLMDASRLWQVVTGRWFPHRNWERVKRAPIITGRHPGCVERRRGLDGVCEYDGKLSLARYRERFYMYARANLKPDGGGRFVQVAQSAGDSPSSGFGPFALLSILGYDPVGPGNIYLTCVTPCPFGLEAACLLGLFAVNLGGSPPAQNMTRGRGNFRSSRDAWRDGNGLAGGGPSHEDGNTDGHSFIGLSFSCDGRRWSELVEIAPSKGERGRTHDHPVCGLLEHEGAAEAHAPSVSALIHRDVYFIAPSATTTSRLMRVELSRAGLERSARAARRRLGCR